MQPYDYAKARASYDFAVQIYDKLAFGFNYNYNLRNVFRNLSQADRETTLLALSILYKYDHLETEYVLKDPDDPEVQKLPPFQKGEYGHFVPIKMLTEDQTAALLQTLESEDIKEDKGITTESVANYVKSSQVGKYFGATHIPSSDLYNEYQCIRYVNSAIETFRFYKYSELPLIKVILEKKDKGKFEIEFERNGVKVSCFRCFKNYRDDFDENYHYLIIIEKNGEKCSIILNKKKKETEKK
jgi:hypothetical protein